MFDATFPYPGINKDGGDIKYLPPGKELEPHTDVRKLVSIEWMRLFLDADFWDYHILRYGENTLVPDDPVAVRLVFWNQDENAEGNLHFIKNAAVHPNVEIGPNLSPGDKRVLTILNTRRSMHRLARDRLLEVVGVPPVQGQSPAPEAPQAQGTEQNQGGPQAEGQPPAAGPEGQEVPPEAPAPAPAPEPRDPPTPTSAYELPDDPPPVSTASMVAAANKIATYLKQFRNRLGLHVVATCTEDALWFHLAYLVQASKGPVITAEEWKFFLGACNSTGAMLRYVFPSPNQSSKWSRPSEN